MKNWERKWKLFDYLVSGMLIRHKDWRAGQGMFNALELFDPKLASQVRGTRYDTFHNNFAIADLTDFLKTTWAKENLEKGRVHEPKA